MTLVGVLLKLQTQLFFKVFSENSLCHGRTLSQTRMAAPLLWSCYCRISCLCSDTV